MITKSSAEAQNQFGQLLDLAQREPVAITRHGRPAAFVISTQDMDSFRDLREEKRRRLAEDWEEWRKQARAGMTAEAGALTEEEIVRMVHELR
jgi:antitoxin Phd